AQAERRGHRESPAHADAGGQRARDLHRPAGRQLHHGVASHPPGHGRRGAHRRDEPSDAPRLRVRRRTYGAGSSATRGGAWSRRDHRARSRRVTLELYRIDDRLIHGQVVVGWGQPLDIDFIVLVDDTVAASDWEQELYRMGVPPEMDVYFHNAHDAIAAMPKYAADPRRGILLTGDIPTMQRLVDGGVVSTVNVGGIHSKPGRVQRLRYVFLSPDEESQLRSLAARGIKVSAQDLPGARSISLPDLLAGSEL